MKDSQKFHQKDITKERFSMTASASADDDGLMNALIDPNQGVFRPGAMPAVQAANEGGTKKLYDCITKVTHLRYSLKFCYMLFYKDNVVGYLHASPHFPHHHLQLSFLKVTKAEKKRNATEKTEKLKPQTLRDQVVADMADLLKGSAETRTASLKINGLAYTEELGKTLKSHAGIMEQTYSDIKKALGGKVEDKGLQGFLKKMDEEMKTAKKLQAHTVQIQIDQCFA